jgi:hypothetical protein
MNCKEFYTKYSRPNGGITTSISLDGLRKIQNTIVLSPDILHKHFPSFLGQPRKMKFYCMDEKCKVDILDEKLT